MYLNQKWKSDVLELAANTADKSLREYYGAIANGMTFEPVISAEVIEEKTAKFFSTHNKKIIADVSAPLMALI